MLPTPARVRGTGSLPYVIAGILNSPPDCCRRNTLRRSVVSSGLGAPGLRPERTPRPNEQENSPFLHMTATPDPPIVVRV